MLKIWGRRDAPNVQKVLWACAELGLEFERIDKGGPFGGADDPAYLALNPNGLVPTIVDDGFVLWESHAILRYLVARTPGQALVPDDLQGRARVDQWLDWQVVHQAAAVRGLAMLFRPGAPPADPAQLQQAVAAAEHAFGLLDRQLAARAYITGDAFSLADIPLAVGVARWTGLPISRPVLPALESWFGRVSRRPAFAVAVLPPKG
jgi:glutathione S-transferase